MTQKDKDAYIKKLEEHIEHLESGLIQADNDCYIKEYQGCCCNCLYMRKVYGHPWVGNTNPNKVFIYGCAARESDSGLSHREKTKLMAIHKHGYCEMWTEIQEKEENGNKSTS